VLLEICHSEGSCTKSNNTNKYKEAVMQFLNNLVSRILAAAKYRWGRIVLHLPFRMAVGRLGIQLVKFGRMLQVRYANWNSEFRLKRTFSINCPERCWIDVSEPVTDIQRLTFLSRNSQPASMTPMVRALFDIKGIARVTLEPYKIHINKGEVFSWEELLPSIERVILEHLTA